MSVNHRQTLINLYHAAVAAVDGRTCTANSLAGDKQAGPVWVIAIGKSAPAMALGAYDTLGDAIASGLVITKRSGGDPPAMPAMFTLIESAHPLPDASSVAAGVELIEFIESVPSNGRIVFLISGGTSALVEQLPGGLDVGTLQQINAWLLSSGLPIQSVNRVRKAVSFIKAGRLVERVGARPVSCLMLSDVPNDDPCDIGSGLLVAHQPEDLDITGLDLPDWLTDLAQRFAPLPPLGAFANIELRIVATAAMAREAASDAASEQGWEVFVNDSLLGGYAAEQGKAMAGSLLMGPQGLTIHSSESTVRLPDDPGIGGRCQQLALSAAHFIAGREDVWLLAAGTDGDDGPYGATGAVVDGNTIARGNKAGLNAAVAIAKADAGRYLEATGDLLVTGPTGTNVMDLILALKL